ncbi:MAG: hypothetical protein R6V58_15530 [Planctomycetota bacterium]
MPDNFVLRVAAAALLVASAASAAEDFEPEEVEPEEIAELFERMNNGAPLGPEQLRLLNRHARRRLFRVRCNELEGARFALAELQLKADRPEAAIKTLRTLAGDTKSADVRSAARYDIARIYRHVMRDKAKAKAALQAVEGRFAPYARRELLALLEGQAKPGEAIAYLQKAVKEAKEKGEKLALLRRLARFCQDRGRTEDAIGALRQISDAFTENDIQGMRRAAVVRVEKAFQRARTLWRHERGEEADRTLHRVSIWMGQLAAAGRTEEFHAARRAFERIERELEAAERAEQGAEEEFEDEE